MFEVIEPHSHNLNKPSIELFLQTLKKYNSLNRSFLYHKEETFFFFREHTHNVHGGALLLKKNVFQLHEKIRNKIPSFFHGKKEVWTCTVSLHMDNEHLPIDFEPICKNFYEKLLEQLVEFGCRQETNYLYMTLEPGEYLCTEIIGFWPYVLEVKPHDSRDGLFHGILSVAPQQNKPYNEV